MTETDKERERYRQTERERDRQTDKKRQTNKTTERDTESIHIMLVAPRYLEVTSEIHFMSNHHQWFEPPKTFRSEVLRIRA